jgi:CDP-glucose 4,6-dehydratase
LLSDLSKYWGFSNVDDAYRITANIPFHEAGLLKLNCDKALFHLKWESNLDYPETIKLVSQWYHSFYKTKSNMYDLTIEQIEEYENIAIERNRTWSQV